MRSPTARRTVSNQSTLQKGDYLDKSQGKATLWDRSINIARQSPATIRVDDRLNPVMRVHIGTAFVRQTLLYLRNRQLLICTWISGEITCACVYNTATQVVLAIRSGD